MIITKPESNIYKIKILNKDINIYNPLVLEETLKTIIKKIRKKNKLKNLLIADIYQDKLYGTIIIIKIYKKIFNIANEIEIKINVHTTNTFLYEIDYFYIKDKNITKRIYYYNKNFYISIKDNIKKEEYLNILEHSKVLYNNTEEIINKGIKINI